MGIEYFPTVVNSPSYYVYALLCQDNDGPGYVKLGMSGNVTQRLTSLRSSCPIPAKYIATVKIGHNREKCLKVEGYLHREFAERKIKMRGEWFRFNFSDPDDKKEFNRGCKRVLRHFFGVAHPWWDIISVGALDEYNEQRRNEFLHSKHRKKIEAKARYKTQQRAAWRELG